MPLPILVAVVAAGISLIVLAVHLTGGSRGAEIADVETAVDRFAIDYPEAAVTRCVISADGRDAVLQLADGRLGLVHAVGSKYLTRHVSRGEMSAKPDGSGNGAVDLDTGDITWPRTRMAFADDETARKVAELFAAKAGDQAQKRAA